ncbi:MAG: hypothetical protein V1800_17770 [Candidatus Latescibacterota bacterium]
MRTSICAAGTGPRSPKTVARRGPSGFKSAVTRDINQLRQTPGVSVWQRNYYERVIRTEADYGRIAEYVITNPQRWCQDILHPDT